MSPEQCRMARAALKWSIRDLALRAGLAHNTILHFEGGKRAATDLSIAHIRAALAEAGIVFVNGDTVTLRKRA